MLRGPDVEGGQEAVICRGEGDGGGDLQLLLKGREEGVLVWKNDLRKKI